MYFPSTMGFNTKENLPNLKEELGKAIQTLAPGLEFVRLQLTAGFRNEVMDVRRRVLVELFHRARLRPEHLGQGLAVEIIASRLAAR